MSVSDGIAPVVTSTETRVTVTGLNVAPMLGGGQVTLAGTAEDTAGSGTTVATILVGLTYSDPNPQAMAGIAVTAASGSGTWQYSADGVTWTAFGAVSDHSALLLSSATQVRFVPAADAFGPAVLSFRGWDRTSGTASTAGAPQYADPGAGGGSSAFSAGSAGATLTVAPVADTPTVSGGTLEAGGTLRHLVITRNPADGPEVTHYRITHIIGGTLYRSDGTTRVAEGDFIPASDGTAGLVFVAATSPQQGGFDVQAATGASADALGGGVVRASITVTAAAPRSVPAPAPAPLPGQSSSGGGNSSSSPSAGSTAPGDTSASGTGGTGNGNAAVTTRLITPGTMGTSGGSDGGTGNGNAGPTTRIITLGNINSFTTGSDAGSGAGSGFSSSATGSAGAGSSGIFGGTSGGGFGGTSGRTTGGGTSGEATGGASGGTGGRTGGGTTGGTAGDTRGGSSGEAGQGNRQGQRGEGRSSGNAGNEPPGNAGDGDASEGGTANPAEGETGGTGGTGTGTGSNDQTLLFMPGAPLFATQLAAAAGGAFEAQRLELAAALARHVPPRGRAAA